MWLETTLGVPLNILLLCLIAGGTRVFLAVEPATINGIIGNILAAIFLALVLHPMLVDEDYSKGWITFLVATGSFAGRDILLIIPKLVAQIKKDPLAIIREYLNFRAGNTPPEDKE